MKASAQICLCILFFIVAESAAKLSCKSSHNAQIPWFFDYKFPGNATSNYGTGYAYLDPQSTNGFTFSSGTTDEVGGALHNTITFINSFSSLSILAFNDEPPSEEWVPWGAHSKGVVAWDDETKTGVYILHSAPKFPNVSISGKINTTLPSNTKRYAQHFYCQAFEGEGSLENIIQNLRVVWPVFYFQSGKFTDYNFWNSKEASRISTFTATDGSDVLFFSKSPNNSNFLYEKIMEPYLQKGLEVQSWGRPYQKAVCSPYESLNVVDIKFSNAGWDHYSDHSKWAITIGSSSQQACACDMNRMDSQAKRGGSCMCISNSVLYNGLKNIIAKSDVCGIEDRIRNEELDILKELNKVFLGF